MNNNCKEIRILTEILKIENLTLTEKVILSQIDALDRSDGCFASNAYFAELFFLSKTQVSKIISDLKRKGWISVGFVYKVNTKAIDKRIIKVNHPPYPIVVKEPSKLNDNTPIKLDYKDKYKRNKYKSNYKGRDFPEDHDWDQYYDN